MRKRLDDVKAIIAQPKHYAKNENESVSIDIRKIDNGYITRRSTSNDQGYQCSEVYTPDKPALEASPKSAPNSMRRAINYLK